MQKVKEEGINGEKEESASVLCFTSSLIPPSLSLSPPPTLFNFGRTIIDKIIKCKWRIFYYLFLFQQGNSKVTRRKIHLPPPNSVTSDLYPVVRFVILPYSASSSFFFILNNGLPSSSTMTRSNALE